NVLSVGGTKLSMYNNQYYTESVWNNGTGSDRQWWASGGGYSKVEPEPAYQSGVQRSGKRGAVDVSANAEPNTYIYSQGKWILEGGRSAATPEWAAMIAIADEGRAVYGRGSFAGVNQAIYSLPAVDFHDITSGNNGYYYAGAGWDPVTGRGTP